MTLTSFEMFYPILSYTLLSDVVAWLYGIYIVLILLSDLVAVILL